MRSYIFLLCIDTAILLNLSGALLTSEDSKLKSPTITAAESEQSYDSVHLQTRSLREDDEPTNNQEERIWKLNNVFDFSSLVGRSSSKEDSNLKSPFVEREEMKQGTAVRPVKAIYVKTAQRFQDAKLKADRAEEKAKTAEKKAKTAEKKADEAEAKLSKGSYFWSRLYANYARKQAIKLRVKADEAEKEKTIAEVLRLKSFFFDNAQFNMILKTGIRVEQYYRLASIDGKPPSREELDSFRDLEIDKIAMDRKSELSQASVKDENVVYSINYPFL